MKKVEAIGSGQVHIHKVDYSDPKYARDLLSLLDHYAQDPMGGGQVLDDSVRSTLVNNLANVPGAISLLAYKDDLKAVGLLNAFMGFSTFVNKPLLNIHDIVVHRQYRGLGVAQQLLGHLEEIAREKGCCKLTLEVLSGNQAAQASYRKFGFSPYELDPEQGSALFFEKKLGEL